MAVTKPDSGGIITKQSVTNMHVVVQNNVNAIQPEYIGGSALGIPQVDPSSSPLVAFDFVNKDASSIITMNTLGNDDTIGDVLANWQHLSDFQLDNNGAGFTTVGPSQYVVYFTCQIPLAKIGSSIAFPAGTSHVMFAISYEDNLGTETGLPQSIMGYGLYDTKDVTQWRNQEIPVAMWVSFNLPTGKIIDKIKFYSCILLGGISIVNNVEITSGSSGCFVFERI